MQPNTDHRGDVRRPLARVLEREQLLPAPVGEVFAFFADAGNLDRITPPFLRFRILTPLPIELREGTLIDYRLRLRGVPIRWRTRISVWQPPHRFVDEQLRGPYRLWQHEHTFEPVGDGTLCRDVVRYRHWGGSIAERLLVRPDLERIFDYRSSTLRSIFGPPAGPGPTLPGASPPNANFGYADAGGAPCTHASCSRSC